MKTRKMKETEYHSRYDDIPKDFIQRLNYICDLYHIDRDSKYDDILAKRDLMLANMYFYRTKIILYEEPEGSPRPRFKLVNRENIRDYAKYPGSFVHVYSITGQADKIFLRRLIHDQELLELQHHLLYTPCDVEYSTFSKTPSVFNGRDVILCEIGLIRPQAKPDWDNIGKKYSDMYSGNVWVDDIQVIRGTVSKFYSILPRVEIDVSFLNAMYCPYQYKQMSKKLETDDLRYFNSKGELMV